MSGIDCRRHVAAVIPENLEQSRYGQWFIGSGVLVLFTIPNMQSQTSNPEREVVLAAVINDGLEYASEEHRADREIVFAAVNNNGCALRYASEDLGP